MDRSNSKPPPRPAKPADPPSSPEKAPEDRTTGRVKFDDRGNAIWEWSIATGAFGLDASAGRLKKLENPSLAIAEDAAAAPDVVKLLPPGATPGAKKGYDPYDSGRPAKAAAAKPGEKPKKKDLRRLSEWIALRKQANSNKDSDD